LVKGNNARRRILIVDDEPDVTLTLKTVLENNGYTVNVFNDPIIALRNFKKAAGDDTTTANENEKEKKHRYSLVLTDVRMPNMNGFDLYEKIRELERHQSSLLLIINFQFQREPSYCFLASYLRKLFLVHTLY
jgi:CheY-like chemotaxis protein